MWKKIICYLSWLSNTFTAVTFQPVFKKKNQQKTNQQKHPTKKKNHQKNPFLKNPLVTKSIIYHFATLSLLKLPTRNSQDFWGCLFIFPCVDDRDKKPQP